MVSRAETDKVNLPVCLGGAAWMWRAGIYAWHATLRCRGIELFSILRPLYPKGRSLPCTYIGIRNLHGYIWNLNKKCRI